MKKIGIVTFANAYNYGAFFQQYALQQYLKSCGYEADIIDYRSEILTQQYRYALNLFRKKGYEGKKYILFLFFKEHRNFRDRLRKQKKFRKCIRRELKMSEIWSPEKNDVFNEYYDFFIAGSDQVWNRYLTGDDGFYFLDFVKNPEKKKTYAVSFGSADCGTEEMKALKEKVKDFSHVLIREGSGKALLKKLGIPSDVVLDPVFLIERRQWLNFAKKSDVTLPKKYIFLYIVVSQKTLYSAAFEYAEKNRCEIVFVTSFDADAVIGGKVHNTVDMDIYDFIKYLRYADAVFTNSFHGLALSAFLNVDFYYERGEPVYFGGKTPVNVNTRLENLAGLLGTEDREIKDGMITEGEIDWETVNRRVEELKRASKEKLEEELRREGGENEWIADKADDQRHHPRL